MYKLYSGCLQHVLSLFTTCTQPEYRILISVQQDILRYAECCFITYGKETYICRFRKVVQLMTRNRALISYLAGTLGQIILVCAVVFFLRQLGFSIDFTTPAGMAAIAIGGISSALWGAILSVKYRGIKPSEILFDFFKIKQSYKDYLILLIFLCLDFLPVIFGGQIKIGVWYLPFILFLKALIFGGIEEIGWRYFFQPVLQEKINYILATLGTLTLRFRPPFTVN